MSRWNKQVDVWSLGCILAELHPASVLCQNDSRATLLARVVGILGPLPGRLTRRARYYHKYFTRSGLLYQTNPEVRGGEWLTHDLMRG